MMSVTGVLLTYERQMLAWADRVARFEPPAGAVRQPIEALLAAARLHSPELALSAVTIANDPTAPAVISAGRAGALLVNPYTAQVSEQGGKRLRAFFQGRDGLASLVQRERRQPRGRARDHRREQSHVLVLDPERDVFVAAAHLEVGRVQDASVVQSARGLGQGSRLQLASRVRNLERAAARHRRRDCNGVLVSVGEQSRLSQRRRAAAGQGPRPGRPRRAGRRWERRGPDGARGRGAHR